MRRTKAPQPRPVFVGGTGRSGTSVLGRLIGQHSRYVDLPFELRFHVDNRGLTYLLDRRSTMDDFAQRMRGSWYQRPDRRGGSRGLHRLIDEDAFERALAAFKRGYRLRPRKAARRLIDAIVEPYVDQHAGEDWVDSTPYNIRGGATLLRLYPEAKFIHVARDGRDVASSVMRRSWGPDDFREALAWWEVRRSQAEEGARQLPDDRLLEVQLEELLVTRREETFGRLLRFLEVADEPDMRAYFEEKMPATGAHLGRWRKDVPEAEQPAVEEEYRAMLERLGISRAGYADRREPLVHHDGATRG